MACCCADPSLFTKACCSSAFKLLNFSWSSSDKKGFNIENLTSLTSVGILVIPCSILFKDDLNLCPASSKKLNLSQLDLSFVPELILSISLIVLFLFSIRSLYKSTLACVAKFSGFT